jgi:hypothetical protein
MDVPLSSSSGGSGGVGGTDFRSGTDLKGIEGILGCATEDCAFLGVFPNLRIVLA